MALVEGKALGPTGDRGRPLVPCRPAWLPAGRRPGLGLLAPRPRPEAVRDTARRQGPDLVGAEPEAPCSLSGCFPADLRGCRLPTPRGAEALLSRSVVVNVE
ncbi:hypothetical protein SORBI_3001G267050 [Sorghum bicolor]|uniref:Uncharacterized protein n=1 Tax=Sorghum bicolor TaxID=4558 RepID=A0A1Z5S892_SORBI|nr:hypothetical protein SORBI_3001G267050 [Sorghum bicolor]